MKNKIFIYLFFLFNALILCHCKKEMASWDSDLQIPIAHANLSIQNISPSNFTTNHATNLMHFQSSDTLYQSELSELINIPTTFVSINYKSPFNIKVLPGNKYFSLSDSIEIKTPDAMLHQLNIKSGILHYEIQSTIKGSTDLIFSIPKAIRNGKPLLINLNIPAGSAYNQANISGDINLEGYNLNLTGDFNRSFNQLNTKVEFFNHNLKDTLYITLSDSIRINISIEQLVPEYIEGVFNSKTISLEAPAIPLSLFKKFTANALSLNDAKLSLKFINKTGIAAQIIIDKLNAYNSVANKQLEINNSSLKDPIYIDRATINNTNPFTIKAYETTTPINSKTAEDLINLMPDKLDYKLNLIFNPYSTNASEKNFIVGTEGLTAILNTDIPLALSFKDLSFKDTIEIKPNNSAFKKINHGALNLWVNNAFPFEISIKMHLLDNNNKILESILIPTSIPAGNSKNTSSALLEIVANTERLTNLYHTARICFEAFIKNPNQNNLIYIRPDQFIEFNLSTEFNTTLNQ